MYVFIFRQDFASLPCLTGLDMRVIEDRCPFSDAMAKKGKKRAAQRNATPNNFYNSLVNIEDDSTGRNRLWCYKCYIFYMKLMFCYGN